MHWLLWGKVKVPTDTDILLPERNACDVTVSWALTAGMSIWSLTSMSFLGAWRRKGRLYKMSCSMGAFHVGPECCSDLSRLSTGLQFAHCTYTYEHAYGTTCGMHLGLCTFFCHTLFRLVMTGPLTTWLLSQLRNSIRSSTGRIQSAVGARAATLHLCNFCFVMIWSLSVDM